MDRRTVLGAALSLGASAAAGCFGFDRPSGVNETVEVDSEFDSELTLALVVAERRDGEYHRVAETDVTVAPNGNATRDLLGQSQYSVTVSGPDETVEFTTRPICDDAVTRIVVRESGRLDYYVIDCEAEVHTRDGES